MRGIKQRDGGPQKIDEEVIVKDFDFRIRLDREMKSRLNDDANDK
jgi:hypothetical protein